ncbi:DUF3427 domain-containing protein [Actinomyces howellii]|uniref:Type I restriction enzyme EcoKI subunit R n=1 Tax=Actinomyces howellii TaxID=52771 RepID=A0A3S4SNA2_9ACTO|nr:DUF3427 domain-containing protein [Actinomyces howellii]VEG28557.1 type I restriction enzyme EcoKI subunit R [Actinomyces howellii]
MTGIGPDALRPGVTEALRTRELDRRLDQLKADIETRTKRIDDAEVPERYARHVADIVRIYIDSLRQDERQEAVDRILSAIDCADQAPLGQQQIVALLPRGKVVDRDYIERRPETPLNDAALLTNAPQDPSMNSELRAELASADQVDLLCAFVKWNGLRLLENELRSLKMRGARLRVITTTYMGATERRALDRLIREFGAEVKIQYDSERTRLHAKSWYFHRATGWDTAYVGSSNLSRSALLDGVEWNVRLSKEQTGPLLVKFRRTFESYWNDPSYVNYNPDADSDMLDQALQSAGGGKPTDLAPSFVGLDIRALPHQEEILERLRVERKIRDRHKNLVVAATGTGKTVVAALDYRDNLCGRDGSHPSLLFVAHRIELLEQARYRYRAVLKDGSFGEILAEGHEPTHWKHVFATVQSLTSRLDRINPNNFQVVVVDEFHHAAASSYKKLLRWCDPEELLGLTATPERADGIDVRTYFGGRATAEIRLWDALESDLLSPFHYFAIADNTDLRQLPWSRGRYNDRALEELYVGNSQRTALIIEQLNRRVLDTTRMHALGFCVSVQHAEYMAHAFSAAGIPSHVVSGKTDNTTRRQALSLLKNGEINAIFTVDLYNEGIDLPAIDTIMFLRPTESATIFLQQLGRGLRKDRNKSVLTVLDYVGLQHRNFRFDSKLSALTGASRRELESGVKDGFSYLPPGTEITLDQVSQQIVLDSIKRQVRPSWKRAVSELREVAVRRGECSLINYLDDTELELSDVLRRSKGQNWTALREAAGLRVEQRGAYHDQIVDRARVFAHVDDLERIDVYRRVLSGSIAPWDRLTDRERTLALMSIFAIWPGGGGFRCAEEAFDRLRNERAACAEFLSVLEVAESRISHVSEPVQGRLECEVIQAHAHYSREEIAVGMKYGGFDRRPDSLREGVFFSDRLRADALLVTLRKTEKHYSPTTMYNDVAVAPDLFHWESQSTTSVDSPVGQRYLNHRSIGTEVVLFVRENKTGQFGAAAPYMCLGSVDYLRHEGSSPIGVDWRLRQPMPADMFRVATLT